jgi:hypothetical protein
MAFALPLFAQVFDLFLPAGQPAGSARPQPRILPAPARRSVAVPVAAAPSEGLGGADIDAPQQRAPIAQRSWGGPTRSAPLQRPLRVVRVLDGRHARAGAGRMVISGRMADVCAELDRLAELERRH